MTPKYCCYCWCCRCCYNPSQVSGFDILFVAVGVCGCILVNILWSSIVVDVIKMLLFVCCCFLWLFLEFQMNFVVQQRLF